MKVSIFRKICKLGLTQSECKVHYAIDGTSEWLDLSTLDVWPAGSEPLSKHVRRVAWILSKHYNPVYMTELSKLNQEQGDKRDKTTLDAGKRRGKSLREHIKEVNRQNASDSEDSDDSELVVVEEDETEQTLAAAQEIHEAEVQREGGKRQVKPPSALYVPSWQPVSGKKRTRRQAAANAAKAETGEAATCSREEKDVDEQASKLAEVCSMPATVIIAHGYVLM